MARKATTVKLETIKLEHRRVAEKKEDNRKKRPEDNTRTSRTSHFVVSNFKSERLFVKRDPEHYIQEWQQPREFIPWGWVQSAQHSKHSIPTAKKERSLSTAPAGGRPWHHPCSSDFKCMQNGRVVR